MDLFNNLKARGSLLIGCLFIAVVILIVLQIPSNAQPICVVDQITDETSGTSFQPSISGDGTRIAYTSIISIADERIVLFDSIANTFTHISNEAKNPSISGDGMRIAFVTHFPNELNQISLFDTITNTVTEIAPTFDLEFDAYTSINEDGQRIAFSSDFDITGGNPDEYSQLFLFDVNTNIISQITNTKDWLPIRPSINANGTRIAFNSLEDINGGNPEGNEEIFLYDTNTNTITQVTNEITGRNNESSINANGTRISFTSTANINGGNPEGNDEIYLYDTITNTVTQITNELIVDGKAGKCFESSINADGSRIAFICTSNERIIDLKDRLFLADCSNADLVIDNSGTDVQDDNIKYNYSIANSGPQDATGVKLVDTLPTNAEFVSAESSKGTCQASEASANASEIIARQTGGTVTCDIGTLAVGDTVEVEIVVTPIDADQIQNTAEINSDIPDPNTDNNSVTTTIVVEEPTRNSGGCTLTGVSEAGNELLDFIFLLLPLLFIGVRVMKSIVTKVHT